MHVDVFMRNLFRLMTADPIKTMLQVQRTMNQSLAWVLSLSEEVSTNTEKANELRTKDMDALVAKTEDRADSP